MAYGPSFSDTYRRVVTYVPRETFCRTYIRIKVVPTPVRANRALAEAGNPIS
jgi:hypothetical protein